MTKLDNQIDMYYEMFKGLPNGAPIVRNNIKNDAFPIVVLKALYNEQIPELNNDDILTFAKYIVAPPDNGIDIIVERSDLDVDERHFDIIQVKNSDQQPLDIRTAFSYMRDTISKYLTKPESISDHLKKVLSDFEFSKDDRLNCTYYVVHRGDTKYYNGIDEKKEIVITGNDIENYLNVDVKNPRVKFESFSSDQFNNFILYEEDADTPAILMNLCGYGLAELAEKYDNTALGRNILFGQNLREGLVKSSTYDGMISTIRNEPERFWFYNNGITILTEDYNVMDNNGDHKTDKFSLSNFSIINGAQTTSALGKFLKQAKLNHNNDDIEKLKKVFVLARVLKVNNNELMSKIAMYNNTQNPITTRDMASGRPEQVKLFETLKTGSPAIFVSIRRGQNKPATVYFAKHRCTNNEELAQLSFAGFLRDPSSAKNQKKSLFDIDYKQSEYTVNESYHKIFDENDGVLFKKNNDEIDELLFVHELYKRARSILNKQYKERIDELSSGSYTAEEQEKYRLMYEKRQAICRKCVFFCLTYYYSLKASYASVDQGLVYRYNDYYNDADFSNKLVKAFSKQFLEPTVNMIFDLTKSVNSLDDWIRGKRTDEYNNAISDKLTSNMEIKESYRDEYVNKYKANKI